MHHFIAFNNQTTISITGISQSVRMTLIQVSHFTATGILMFSLRGSSKGKNRSTVSPHLPKKINSETATPSP